MDLKKNLLLPVIGEDQLAAFPLRDFSWHDSQEAVFAFYDTIPALAISQHVALWSNQRDFFLLQFVNG